MGLEPGTSFEFQRTVENLSKPFEQKTEITGHLLPGVIITKQFCQDFASGAAAVTGMTIFGPFVYKNPTNFDKATFDQLGRPPRDYNFSQMWSNSGMDGYIFPKDNMYATLKFHTCKQFDFEKLLEYVHKTLGFDKDMRHTEIIGGKTIIDDKLYKEERALSLESVKRFGRQSPMQFKKASIEELDIILPTVRKKSFNIFMELVKLILIVNLC
jgi:hypothetical protein